LAILQSGLGAGISATAFHRHAISTTIIEIDPAVYDAARTFFGLPDPGPGKVFLEDARSWAATKRASVWTGKNETLYDFIVHDCFSGGGVPEHIFTLEFWNDLQTVLHPEGVVVVVRNRTIRLRRKSTDHSFSTRTLLGFPVQTPRKWCFIHSRKALASAEDFMIYLVICRKSNIRQSLST
jgi:spermidine synthase